MGIWMLPTLRQFDGELLNYTPNWDALGMHLSEVYAKLGWPGMQRGGEG